MSKYIQHLRQEYTKFHEWLFCFLRIPPIIRNSYSSISDTQDLTIPYEARNPAQHNIFQAVPGHDPNPLLLLRTYTHDIELIQPLTAHIPPTRLLAPDLSQQDHFIQRFNLICPIPELGIVLIGSQSGDVVIITLTQLTDPNGLQDPFFTFKQEGVLPLKEHLDVMEKKMMTRCPLLGMAVSPVQGSVGDETRKMVGRRWRVILHYYDHTVLSYELGWESQKALRFGKLDCVAG